ncbi:MAG TPA: glycosyltransferase family A protein [Bryobacteraceae bacterium]|nr:glycosyltransferase family A protein [Bryobacteraceae bacterium]
MDISVVVPTFNRRELVKRAVESLFAQTFPAGQFEVIVVVDGSEDGTADALREMKAPCRFTVVEQPNGGLAAARNAGARVAEGELLLFLDDDMLCVPKLVEAHVEAHHKAPRTVGFGCILLSPESPPSVAAECFNRELGAFYLRQKASDADAVEDLEHVFGNSSLRRKLLKEAGGFDASFKMREDLELWVRLAAMNVQPHYVERAVAYQYYAKTGADLIRDSEAFAVADVMFARKHPGQRQHGQLRLLERTPRWKRPLRRIAAISPAAADLLLAPLCGLGEAFIDVPALRGLGARALQMRRRIHWFHKVLALGLPEEN